MATKLKQIPTYLKKNGPLHRAVMREAAERQCAVSMVVRAALLAYFPQARKLPGEAEGAEVEK